MHEYLYTLHCVHITTGTSFTLGGTATHTKALSGPVLRNLVIVDCAKNNNCLPVDLKITNFVYSEL